METTKKQALKIYDVIIYCDPFSNCSFDKSENIKSLQEFDFESNINNLIDFIREGYNPNEIVNDSLLIKKFNAIFLIDGRKPLYKNNFIDYNLYNKYVFKLLQK